MRTAVHPYTAAPRALAQLGSCERGAVFVEKLITFLPLLFTFFVAWELAELGAAKLVVQRASAAAGRAAVVVLADDPAFYDGEEVGSFSGQREQDISLAAGMILSSSPRVTSSFLVDVSDAPKETGPIEVTVEAEYDCGLVSVFCSEGNLTLASTTTHVYQGSRYEYTLPPDPIGSGAAAMVEGQSAGPRLRAKPGAGGNGNGQNGNGQNGNGQPTMGPKPNLPGNPPLRPHSDQCKCPGKWEVDLVDLRKDITKRKDDFCGKGVTVAWSGGPAVMNAAEKWSNANGGQSLEATAGGKWLNEMGLPNQAFASADACRPIRRADARHLWDYASELLMECAAKNAKKNGNKVVKFQRCDVQTTGALGWLTWERVERPILNAAGVDIECRDYATAKVEPCCDKLPPGVPITSPPGTPTTESPNPIN